MSWTLGEFFFLRPQWVGGSAKADELVRVLAVGVSSPSQFDHDGLGKRISIEPFELLHGRVERAIVFDSLEVADDDAPVILGRILELRETRRRPHEPLSHFFHLLGVGAEEVAFLMVVVDIGFETVFGPKFGREAERIFDAAFADVRRHEDMERSILGSQKIFRAEFG